MNSLKLSSNAALMFFYEAFLQLPFGASLAATEPWRLLENYHFTPKHIVPRNWAALSQKIRKSNFFMLYWLKTESPSREAVAGASGGLLWHLSGRSWLLEEEDSWEKSVSIGMKMTADLSSKPKMIVPLQREALPIAWRSSPAFLRQTLALLGREFSFLWSPDRSLSNFAP